MSIQVKVNGVPQDLNLPADMPLLWALREGMNLTGTRFGCGVAACGACTVLVDGQAVRSCQTALQDVAGAEITTIEGLAQIAPLSALQQAWVDQQVAQCGYCQSGQIMQAAALLSTNPNPSDQEIAEAMDGNLCRCGTYPRILAAIRQASAAMAG